jgi:hypothetical protein
MSTGLLNQSFPLTKRRMGQFFLALNLELSFIPMTSGDEVVKVASQPSVVIDLLFPTQSEACLEIELAMG